MQIQAEWNCKRKFRIWLDEFAGLDRHLSSFFVQEDSLFERFLIETLEAGTNEPFNSKLRVKWIVYASGHS